jgi:hypothetical protein
VADTSSDYVLRDLRRRDHDHARLHGDETFHGRRGSQCKRPQEAPDVAAEPAHKKPCAGPLRAFMRDRAESGVVRTFQDWGREYGELSESERADYALLARSFDDAAGVQDGGDLPQRPAKRAKVSEVGVRARLGPPSLRPLCNSSKLSS